MTRNQMRNRLTISILLFAFACASIALLIAKSEPKGSVTLAELLLLPKEKAQPPYSFNELIYLRRAGDVRLAGLEPQTFFYGVLGICGILLALRAVISALQIHNEERLLRMRRRAANNSARAPETPITKDRDWRPRADPAGAGSRSNSGAEKLSVSERWMGRRRFIPHHVWARLAPYKHGLTGRMIVSFTAIVAAFGLLTVTVVHFTLTAALRKNAIQRAKLTAANVSDISAAYLAKNNAKGLRELLARHANRPEMAYILVQNRAGEILGHSFAMLPQEIRTMPPVGDAQHESQRLLRIGDGEVFEMTMPVMNGQLGTVRVGIWRDEINAEINRTEMPLLKVLLSVVGAGILVAFYLAWRINRPIVRLVRAAQRISTGDLEAPSLGVEDNSEFGELSRSFERMRSSIKAGMVRIRDDR
jgi:HAMP domain-containing protein